MTTTQAGGDTHTNRLQDDQMERDNTSMPEGTQDDVSSKGGKASRNSDSLERSNTMDQESGNMDSEMEDTEDSTSGY